MGLPGLDVDLCCRRDVVPAVRADGARVRKLLSGYKGRSLSKIEEGVSLS